MSSLNRTSSSNTNNTSTSTTTNTDASGKQQEQQFSADAIRHNNQVINYARSSLAAVAGFAAGILGLEGWVPGISFYVLASMILSSTLYLISSKGNPRLYFSSSSGVWTDQVFGNLFSYMLFWTMGYGLVHVYD